HGRGPGMFHLGPDRIGAGRRPTRIKTGLWHLVNQGARSCVPSPCTYDPGPAQGSRRSRRAGIRAAGHEGAFAMVAAVRVHKTGGPEVLTFEDIDVPAPGPGQLRVKQGAAGINYIDTYFRMGMYPSPVGLPFVAGNEGAGTVVAVGPDVTDFKVGD